jgi:acetylornithine aminotransferase
VGAVLAYGDRAAHLLGRGQHGTTFGGNPVAAAAALATIGVIERDDLLTNVRDVGGYLAERVTGLGHPLLAGVRGAGLLRGIALAAPVSADVAQRALAAGLIVNPVAPDALRVAPPYLLTRDQVDDLVAFLAELPHDLGQES